MKILVTGAAGFIGSKLSANLANRGHRVIGVDDLSKGIEENIPVNIDFFKFDLSKKKVIKNLKI